MTERDQKFVEMVVKEIVDNPEDVKVDRTVDDRGVLLTLSINPADMGKVIGKEGKTAEALRTLLRIIGAKNNARVNLKILEPEGQEGRPPREERAPREEAPKKETPKEEPVAEEASTDIADSTDSTTDTQPIEEENATEII